MITAVNKELASRNIKLIVMIVPTKATYYRNYLPDGLSVAQTIDQRYDSILASLKAGSVQTVDVRDAFKEVLEQNQLVFYRTDYHWTSVAAEAAADQVAALITKDGPLPGEAGSGTKLGEWMNDRHLGDLAANFLSPDRKRAIGPESFAIRKPQTSGGALVDDGPAPVAVVGNSFVQPYFGFPQRLSNSLDRPVFLKWNAGDVGPWVTLLQYVQSREFRSAPPKFVVWQFIEAKFQNGPEATGEWLPQGIMDYREWQRKTSAGIQSK